MPIHLLTLPEPRVSIDSTELPELSRKRQLLALFLYLSIERTATRDTVLSIFWPDKTEERARHAFSQALYELKQLFKQEWLQTRGDKLVVQANVVSDLAAFEAAVRESRYEDALQLYHGTFLQGMHLTGTSGFQSWLDLRRAHTGRLYRRACREVVAARLRADDLHGALAAATRWSELEPLDDEAAQRTIEFLARLGRRTEAIREFEAFEERLQREELEPMPELRNMVAEIRAGTLGPAVKAAVLISTPPNQDELLSSLPADFEVARLLGEGQSARVYLAREKPLGRYVAIKVLSPRSLTESVEVRRFEREARAAARIQHPNVTPVFRVGALANGARYLVMSFVDGGSLEDRLAALGRFNVAEARRAIAQIAAGLAAAHRIGIVHRDLRPGNVLYDRHSDRFLITDFGLASLIEADTSDDPPLTKPGERIGVPFYASPEQLRGEPVSERTDVYSLGVVAFELLTGELPFGEKAGLRAATAPLHENQPAVSKLRSDVDPTMDQLINRCLQSRPEHRPFAAEIASTLASN